jgi:hypothetical protein
MQVQVQVQVQVHYFETKSPATQHPQRMQEDFLFLNLLSGLQPSRMSLQNPTHRPAMLAVYFDSVHGNPWMPQWQTL